MATDFDWRVEVLDNRVLTYASISWPPTTGRYWARARAAGVYGRVETMPAARAQGRGATASSRRGSGHRTLRVELKQVECKVYVIEVTTTQLRGGFEDDVLGRSSSRS